MGAPVARPRRRATGWVVACAAGVLALAVRWFVAGGASGVRGYHGYDDGVYFAAAVALVHGRLPYADVLFLHPPGVVLALAPSAALTRWVDDPTALAAARVGVMVLGALSTVLVARLALRWGVAASVTGGVLYAVSSAAVYTERLTLLEPFGTFTLLLAVALLLRGVPPAAPRWWLYAGGAVLGLGPVVKIWNVVPVLVVLGWLWLARDLRTALRAAAAAAASAALVLLPFAVAAGRQMLELVVLAQLGRARAPDGAGVRVEGILGVSTTQWPEQPARTALTVLVLGVVVAAAVAAWRADRGRLWVAVLAAQGAVVLAAPSYFASYAAYSAPAVVLVVAAGVSVVPARARAAGAVLVCLALGVVAGVPRAPAQSPFPVAQVRALLPATGCVYADSPGALAVLDLLSRDERLGCAPRVDVSGQTYVVGDRDPDGSHVPRARNERWQDDAVAYLTSGDAAVVVRPTGNGFSDATVERLHGWGSAARVGGVEVLLLPEDGRD